MQPRVARSAPAFAAVRGCASFGAAAAQCFAGLHALLLRLAGSSHTPPTLQAKWWP